MKALHIAQPVSRKDEIVKRSSYSDTHDICFGVKQEWYARTFSGLARCLEPNV